MAAAAAAHRSRNRPPEKPSRRSYSLPGRWARPPAAIVAPLPDQPVASLPSFPSALLLLPTFHLLAALAAALAPEVARLRWHSTAPCWPFPRELALTATGQEKGS